MIDKVIRSTRHASMIDRYHTYPTLQKQDNASHTYGVLRIYIETFGPPPPEVTVYITYHDSGELATGDVPYDAKRANPDLKELVNGIADEAAFALTKGVFRRDMITEPQHAMVKFCDNLEMAEFGIEEMKLGNMYYGSKIVQKILNAMQSLPILAMSSAARSRYNDTCIEFNRLKGMRT